MKTGHTRFCDFLNGVSGFLGYIGLPFYGVSFQPTDVHGEQQCPRCKKHRHCSGMDEHSLVFSPGRASKS